MQQIVCGTCDKHFKLKVALLHHKKKKHSKPKLHKCETCDKTFTYRALINHQRNVHEENDKKPVLCIICKKILSTNDKLKRHIT